MIKKDGTFLLLSMYRIGFEWQLYTSHKYPNVKSDRCPTGGYDGSCSRVRMQINCRKCMINNELYNKGIQTRTAWMELTQYSHEDEPFAKCRHFTVNECLIDLTDEPTKGEPCMQCRKIMVNYDDPIATMIHGETLNQKIPKADCGFDCIFCKWILFKICTELFL